MDNYDSNAEDNSNNDYPDEEKEGLCTDSEKEISSDSEGYDEDDDEKGFSADEFDEERDEVYYQANFTKNFNRYGLKDYFLCKVTL